MPGRSQRGSKEESDGSSPRTDYPFFPPKSRLHWEPTKPTSTVDSDRIGNSSVSTDLRVESVQLLHNSAVNTERKKKIDLQNYWLMTPRNDQPGMTPYSFSWSVIHLRRTTDTNCLGVKQFWVLALPLADCMTLASLSVNWWKSCLPNKIK